MKYKDLVTRKPLGHSGVWDPQLNNALGGKLGSLASPLALKCVAMICWRKFKLDESLVCVDVDRGTRKSLYNNQLDIVECLSLLWRLLM